MGIRELREAYWKACTWRPPVVAIIEYLARLDIRFAAMSQNVEAVDTEIEEIESQVGGLVSTIAALQRQMQGAYVRFAGASDSTPTTSPYRKILSIDENSSKVYDTNIQLDMTANANCVKFLAAGRVEFTFSCKFTGSAAGQHIAINSSNVPSTGATQIALSKGTWEEPLLNAIFDVSANACVYMFAGGASNSARNYTPNSTMTYVHTRYLEKY